jgi:SNF2 family DNA or RNA helicase
MSGYITSPRFGVDNLPWPHQTEALEFISNKPGSMLAMDMGTGKSRVVVDLVAQNNYEKVLILAPLSVVANVWPGEFSKHAPGLLNVLPLAGKPTKIRQELADRALKTGRPTAVVMNYDAVWRAPFGDWAMAQDWDLLVMDESHRIKAPGGVASRYCSRLSDRVAHRVALTGTPMAHSPLDIYAQYRAIDKDIYGTSFTRFRSRYAVMGGFNRMQVVAYQREDELRRLFYSRAYRVESDDVLDLPSTLSINLMCDLGTKGRRLYQEVSDQFVADLEEGQITASNALSRLLRLQQITSGYGRLEDGTDVEIDSSKARVLEDTLTDIGNEPVVVFTRFVHDLDVVHRVAAKVGIPSFEVSGRRKDLSEWRGGVLAVQIQAGGLGLDLTRARYAIYYSLGFSLGDYSQSMARLHRPGQSHPVEYIHILASGTVDETVMEALARREAVVDHILKEVRSA